MIAAWAKQNRIRAVCIADWGKNLYATWSACRSAGLTSMPSSRICPRLPAGNTATFPCFPSRQ